MLKVLIQTVKGTAQRLSTKHSRTSSSLTLVTSRYMESSAITNREQCLNPESDDRNTKENRRKFNRRAIFDLCLEKFDDDLLYFPEAMTNEEWTSLVDHGQVVEEAMKFIKYEELLETGKISDESRKKLAGLNLFKMRIPKRYGGEEYMETQAQYIHEILGIRPSVARMLSEQEEMGVKVLVKYGTEAQKAKYLPKVATGEIMLAFAFLEESSSTLDPNSYLGLEVIQENENFTLKGEKSWVFNGKSADVFIVIGTQSVMDDEGIIKITSLFLVDKVKENIIVYRPMEKKWFRGVEICHVAFNDVTVGPESVLGQYGKGFDIFLDIIKNNRTSVLAECSSVMKRLVFDASDKCGHLKIYQNNHLNYDYGDYGVGELSILAYATESLTYYLAGRADYFENPELSIEIALAKIFATEALPEAIHTYFSFVGRFSYERNSAVEEFVQNSHYYSMLDDSIFDMKIYIMSQAIKYLAIKNETKFTQLKAPFSHPVPMMKFLMEVKKHEEDRAKPKLDLRECVHLGVSRAADELEYCINRLAYCSGKHILKHMRHTMEHDYDLLILCEMLANIYALIACIARASRASQLHTQNYATELEMAYAFALRTATKVKNLSSLIGRNQEEMECCAEIGRKAFTNKNYIAEHPLMRNF